MKLTAQDEKELQIVYDAWWHSYLNGDVTTYKSYLDDDYRFIGSTNNEDYLNKKDTTKFFEDTAEPLAGKAELRNLQRTINVIDRHVVLITDLANAYVLNGTEWIFYSRFRFTSLMKKTKEGWRFIYQHFSTPDTKTKDGETLGTEQLSKENQELRDAIKRKTLELEQKNRELNIEAALERVRSRSMAMHRSEELKDVIQIVYEQLVSLDFHIEHAGFLMDYKEQADMHIWLTDDHDVPSKLIIPYFDSPHWNSFNHAKEKGINFFSNHLTFNEKNKFYQDLFKVIPEVTKETSDYYFAAKGLDLSTVLLENVGLYIENFQGLPYSIEENATLMRFGKVFQQTYTRFQDLQKSEEQIREAKIETALERMRSVALNIRTTQEVLLVAESMYNELKILDFTNIRNAQIVIDLKKNDTYLVCIHSDDISEIIRESRYDTSPIIQQLYDELDASKDAFYQKELKGDEFKIWLKWRKSISETLDNRILEAKSISFYLFSIGEGHLGISAFNTISDEKIEILQRFRNVFEMTYRRFIELQKAEAQTRESQIELALERVRARTMAMQHSSELQEASQLLDTQVRELGIETWGCAFNIYGEHESSEWFSTKAGAIPPYKTPRINVFKEYYDVDQKGESLYIKTFEGAACIAHYEFLCTLPEAGEALRIIKKSGGSFPTFQIDHVAFFKQGYLLFITFKDLPEAHDIFKRFAKVFEQTYTRFLDLQKAEAQTKESKIEAALEKVRSVALSLTKSEGMLDIAKSLFEQLLKLGFTDMRNAIIDIHNDDNVSFFRL